MPNSEPPTGEPPLIAHVIFNMVMGGLENGLINLINGLPADRYRHAIICIDRTSDFENRIERDDVEVIEILKKPGRDPAAFWRILQALRRLRPSIVHTRNLAALDALLPAKIIGVRRTIHGEHGWDMDDLEGRNPRPRWLRKLYAPLISHYVTVSGHLERYLIERVGIAPDRIDCIINGVDTVRFRPNPNRVAERETVDPALVGAACLIGTVGRMQRVKDHMTLARSFAHLLREHPDCAGARLAIVGDGPEYSAVSEYLEQAGIRDQVWMPGQRDDIDRMVGMFDVFVQPSLAEGISNTILEAMSCGVPIVATDVGGNPELVEHGITGTLIPASDVDVLTSTLRRYVLDKEMRSRQGSGARELVEQRFSLEQMLESYVAVYDKMLGPDLQDDTP